MVERLCSGLLTVVCAQGFQTGEAGSVVFFNESMKGKDVSLEGVWHYDFSHNRMRADYAESVDGTFSEHHGAERCLIYILCVQ